MERLCLNGQWQMQQIGWEEWIPAQVPGSVYHDLLNAEKMEDPFWRCNEMDALALMEHDYQYTRSFTVEKSFLEHDEISLHCAGLDTLAEITVNGQIVGKADNMHREWNYEVKKYLTEGENSIAVRFFSPTLYIREQYKKTHHEGAPDAMKGFPDLRKAHCMFGWDWGPRLPDAGIWREIELRSADHAVLESIYIRQNHSENGVAVRAEILCREICGIPDQIAFSLYSPDGELLGSTENGAPIMVSNPSLWWPNGYGEHPLYTASVVIYKEGKELDRWEKRIGLRTMKLIREKDEWGESFAHEVNGVRIFAMGADYIPEDNILARVTPERTRQLLEDCVSANFNTLRVWGGGYYPSDTFFDLCDELGFLVWEDLMFACAVYSLTEEFEANIWEEIICNVRRLRHHPSLALWCGNNEMEMLLEANEYGDDPRQKAEYIKMYEYLFPKLLQQLDPDAVYWPASPSSGGAFDHSNDYNRGDVHFWEVWHGCKPFTEYRKYHFRFASEFGFQSFPCLKTVKSFTLPEDRNIFSYVMEKHQRNALANGKIMEYLSQTFLYPKDFETMLYASQLLQAEAIRYGVEHWRRNRGRCMGAIYWQLNDCWPVASWASIDYYGRWKALHYAAKRFFAPVLLSCEEEGLLSQTINVNAEPFEVKKGAKFSVSNETMMPFAGKIEWSLRNPAAQVQKSGFFQVTVDPLSAKWYGELDFGMAETYENYISYRLLDEKEQEISSFSVLFCPPKHFKFMNPELTVERKGQEITVTAKAYAKGVEIDSPDGDLVLSDNYFDMDAGRKTVKILRGEAERCTVRSMYDIR